MEPILAWMCTSVAWMCTSVAWMCTSVAWMCTSVAWMVTVATNALGYDHDTFTQPYQLQYIIL